MYKLIDTFVVFGVAGGDPREDAPPGRAAAGRPDDAGVAAGLPVERRAEPAHPRRDALHGRPPRGQVRPLHPHHDPVDHALQHHQEDVRPPPLLLPALLQVQLDIHSGTPESKPRQRKSR